jgi:hypothetical protein
MNHRYSSHATRSCGYEVHVLRRRRVVDVRNSRSVYVVIESRTFTLTICTRARRCRLRAHTYTAPASVAHEGRRMDTQIAFNAASTTAAARNREQARVLRMRSQVLRVTDTKTCKCSSCKSGYIRLSDRTPPGAPCRWMQTRGIESQAAGRSAVGRGDATEAPKLASHWQQGRGTQALEPEAIAHGAAACTADGWGGKYMQMSAGIGA